MASTRIIPTHAQILVIGGGPGGSYTACALAREGFDVALFEASKFPRYHIGESMLPSVRSFMRFVDAEQKVIVHGFTVKRGAAAKFNQFKREGYTDFIANSPDNASWNVIRSEFDELLLRHAAECGAKVFEETKALDIKFTCDRPTSVTYTNGGRQGEITYDYLVDASGRNGLMSTRYLKNRKMNESLKNIACWGYWEGAGMYMPGTRRENAPWFEALTDESGWGWFIPLHNGTVSVGMVMDLSVSSAKKSAAGKDKSLKDHYLDQFQYVPGLKKLLGEGTLKDGLVKSASDFSYSASAYAGDHFRLVGDASAFIDPFFSSGVHLALSGGLTAAASISASIRGHCTEQQAARFHDVKVGTSYTRFLLVVLGAYKQIRAQTAPILSDINEDNFDRAFDLIRPVIQGTADVQKKLDQDEITKTMQFVSSVLVTPCTPEMDKAAYETLSEELLNPASRPLLPEEIDSMTQVDEESRHVLRKINARKPIREMYDGIGGLVAGSVDGMHAVLERGALGISLHD